VRRVPKQINNQADNEPDKITRPTNGIAGSDQAAMSEWISKPIQ